MPTELFSTKGKAKMRQKLTNKPQQGTVPPKRVESFPSAATLERRSAVVTMGASCDSIIIRDFEPGDLERVKILFRNGMISHVPTLIKLLTKHRLASIDLAHPLVISLPFATLASRPSSTKNGFSAFLVYVGAALLSSLGWFAYHSYLSPKLFTSYINYSIDSDISNIPTVYQSKKGVFLVAATKDTNTVVGMVGGEFKGTELGDDGTHRNVYEIRRLSVGPEAQGRGVGRLLLGALQEKLQQRSRVFADCTNLQPTAQRLYARNGLELTKTFPLEGWPLPFKMWRYEKKL